MGRLYFSAAQLHIPDSYISGLVLGVGGGVVLDLDLDLGEWTY